MAKQAIDPSALITLTRLRENGFSAFAVGGCVRDLLLGRRAHDWDVATSARPEQVLELFDRAFSTGLAHGTVTVMHGRTAVEVTTFRREGSYSDGRHPDNVCFDADLTGDLARRDFTVNAMALDETGQIIDPFGGQTDLKNRILRCVGDPHTRFTEDALRMWRAFRFSATRNFQIENHTWAAIADCAPLAANLSAERLSAEIQKILLSHGTARLSEALSMGLMDAFLERRPFASLPTGTLKRLPRRPDCRWSGFAALLRRSGCLSEISDFLRALRLPNRVSKAASGGADLALNRPMPTDDAGWRQLCSEYGVPVALCAASAADALTGGHTVVVLRTVLQKNPCLSVRELALSGEQLSAVGWEGIEIGRLQRELLGHVLYYPEDNTQEALWRIICEKRGWR